MSRISMILFAGVAFGACKPAPMAKTATNEGTKGVPFALQDIQGRWVTDCEDDERVFGEVTNNMLIHTLVSYGQDHCRMPIMIMTRKMAFSSRQAADGRLDVDFDVQSISVMPLHHEVTAELNQKPGDICGVQKFETNVPVTLTQADCKWKTTKRYSQLMLGRQNGTERLYLTGPVNETDDSLGKSPDKRDRTIINDGAARLDPGAWHPFDEERKALAREQKWKEEHETTADSEGLSLRKTFQRDWNTSFQTL